jgi:hypothetical protein
MALTIGRAAKLSVKILILLTLCAIAPLSGGSGEAASGPQSPPPVVQGRFTLAGNVWLAGHELPPARRLVYKNRAICGSSVPDETLLTSKTGGVRNAVVLLHSLDRVAGVAAGRIVLDNVKCAFAPHVQVAPVGSELLLKNSDGILHTVHARMGNNTLFNIGLPKWRQVTKVLDKPGVVRIDCDVLHTWMTAAIVVAATPYFAVSDDRGYFSVDHLPPGSYRMEVWHESLGTRMTTVLLAEDVPVSADVIFASPAAKSVER